jgi:alpha-beta hydrolase superfamily lysophospholipase
MPARMRRLYADPDVDHWRQYQRFLPESLRTTPDRLPVEEWWTWRSADIHLDRYEVPKEAPTAPFTVILVHGGGGCGRLLAPYGQMLQRHGYEVVAPDLPGYGLSVAPPELFSYHAWVACVADLAAAEHRRTGRPVVLFGMSVGGYLAYLAAAKGRLAAGVIATTLADPRLAIVRDQFARSARLNRLLLPTLPLAASLLGGLRLPIKWFSNMQAISNNAELNRLLCSDPVAGGNPRYLRSSQRSSPKRSTSAPCSLPSRPLTSGPRSKPASLSSTASRRPRSWSCSKTADTFRLKPPASIVWKKRSWASSTN